MKIMVGRKVYTVVKSFCRIQCFFLWLLMQEFFFLAVNTDFNQVIFSRSQAFSRRLYYIKN